MYYCLNVFSNDIYYLENKYVIVIYQKEDNNIDFFDVIGLNEIYMIDILYQIVDEDMEIIIFYFIFDVIEYFVLKSIFINDGLFVKIFGDFFYFV